MDISLSLAYQAQINIAFDLLKHASENLERKGIKQWDYWQNPPQAKIDWVKKGFEANEFYFIKNELEQLMGMVRILDEDLLYWGHQNEKAKYIHSLVVHQNFGGLGIGKQVIKLIEKESRGSDTKFLRLDCDASNSKLCSYYTRQGFEKVGEKQLDLGSYNLYQKEI